MHIPIPPTDHEIEERATRCRAIRQAWEPLAPLVSADERRTVQQRIAEVAASLAAFGDHIHSAQTAGPSEDPARVREIEALRRAFGEIDARLAQETRTLLGALDACSAARRREGWLGIGAPRPEGAAVLLDLVLEDEERLATRIAVVEDLVMLLATDEDQGSRRVARDPAALTARLRAVCGRSAAASGVDLAAAESALIDAARRCEKEPTEVVADAVEEHRQALGLAFLAPRVLRALIFFDAALWNRLAVRPAVAVAEADVVTPTPADEASSAVAPTLTTAAVAIGDGSVLTAAPDAVRWRLDARQVKPPPRPRPRRRRDLRSSAAGVALATFAVFGLFSWMGADPIIRTVPRSQLQSVSTALDSGYRDQRGAGPLFIGTVGSDWEFLPPDQRERSAWQIVDNLTETGVREIVLYGSGHRIAMHYADGLPIRITP